MPRVSNTQVREPGERLFPDTRVRLCQQEHYWFECQVSKVPTGHDYRKWWMWACWQKGLGPWPAASHKAPLAQLREASVQGLPRPLLSWGGPLPLVQTTVKASRADVWWQNKPQGFKTCDHGQLRQLPPQRVGGNEYVLGLYYGLMTFLHHTLHTLQHSHLHFANDHTEALWWLIFCVNLARHGHQVMGQTPIEMALWKNF